MTLRHIPAPRDLRAPEATPSNQRGSRHAHSSGPLVRSQSAETADP